MLAFWLRGCRFGLPFLPPVTAVSLRLVDDE